jgi:hypothetical protein
MDGGLDCPMTDREAPQPDDPPTPDGPNHEALLDYAIDRLVACRTSLPILRRGDLRVLVRTHRIFSSLGSTFVECAPEPLFRQGIRELARSRAVGVQGIAYVTAFTYPEVLTDVLTILESPSIDHRDDAVPSGDEDPTAAPAAVLTPETFPAILCAMVATRVGVTHVRKELEAMRQAPPAPIRRRPPVVRSPRERRPSAERRSRASADGSPATADVTDTSSERVRAYVPDESGAKPDVVEPVIECPAHAGPATSEVDGLTSLTVDAVATATVEAPHHGTTDEAEAFASPLSLDASGESVSTPTDTEPSAVDAYSDSPPVPEQGSDASLMAEAATQPSPADLRALVAALEKVSADTYDWEAVGDAAVALHALHRTRLEERRRDEARQLRSRVHELVGRFKETFDSWGLTATGDAALWSVDGLLSRDTVYVTSLISSLVDAFAQWQDVRDAGEPPMLERREAYRSTLRSAENLIASTYKQLDEALQPRVATEPSVNLVDSAPAPGSRAVIARLLREGHFGTAARLLRAEGPAAVDAADLADTMQRRMEFEFTRPLATVRTIMERPCISLVVLNVAKQLECDLSSLVLQPTKQSVTHRQLAELFWNADIRLRQRHLSDFLGRMWNGIELAVRLRVELAARRRITDTSSVLSWWEEIDPTSPIRTRATASRHFSAFERDGLMSIRGALAILEGLEEEAYDRGDWHENERLHDARVAICALEPVKQLRNDSIVAHGTAAVSEEGIALSLFRSPTRLSGLRIPPHLTGSAEIAWMYRSIMENLGTSLEPENPLLTWGRALADAIQPSQPSIR